MEERKVGGVEGRGEGWEREKGVRKKGGKEKGSNRDREGERKGGRMEWRERGKRES